MIEMPSYKAWVALVGIDRKEYARFPVDDPNSFKFRMPITGYITCFICVSEDEPYENGYRPMDNHCHAEKGDPIVANFNPPPPSWGDIL